MQTKAQKREYDAARYAAQVADPGQRAALLARKRAEHAKRSEALKAKRAAQSAAYLAKVKSDPEKLERRRASARKSARRAQGHLNPTDESRTGACEICQRSARLVLDHDHHTGLARGWLCDQCNRGIGFLQDSPSVLAAAKSYLDTKGTPRLYARVA